MRLIWRKFKTKLIIYSGLLRFSVRKRIISFNNANNLLLHVDKEAIIPILRLNGAFIGQNCDIESPIFFHNCLNYSNFRVGDNSHIGKNCFFDLKDKITIEENVTISMQTTFLTHIDLGHSELSHAILPSNAPIIIENNSYIGSNSTIIQGVRINKSSFVAAGALVNKDVPSYTIVGGVPAKFIKSINKP